MADRHQVRVARDDEFERLVSTELAADTVFTSVGINEVFDPAGPDEYRQALVVLVVGDPALGVTRLIEVDGAAHLDQLSVEPHHARRGLGRALVEASGEWAARCGYRRITLITFRDVAWNAPFYRSCGFTVTDQLGPGLEALWQADLDGRPARHGARVGMRRDLSGAKGVGPT